MSKTHSHACEVFETSLDAINILAQSYFRQCSFHARKKCTTYVYVHIYSIFALNENIVLAEVETLDTPDEKSTSSCRKSIETRDIFIYLHWINNLYNGFHDDIYQYISIYSYRDEMSFL